MFADATKIVFRLNNGQSIPALGLGTANFGHRVAHTKEAVIEAVKLGFRHIDTANSYLTEEVIGEALKEVFDSGVLKREDLFITTKVALPLATDPEKSLNESLTKLGVEYVDLLLQHWPLYTPIVEDAHGKQVEAKLEDIQYDYISYYQKIEDLYLADKNKIRSIGVSNYSIPFLTELLKVARVSPVINQIELHPHLPQIEVVEFCQKNSIVVTAYSPAGGKGAPNIKIPIVQELAQKFNTTPNAILTSYHIKEGRVVIPRTINQDRLKSYTELVDLKDEDLSRLTEFGLKNPKRFIAPEFGKRLGFEIWNT